MHNITIVDFSLYRHVIFQLSTKWSFFTCSSATREDHHFRCSFCKIYHDITLKWIIKSLIIMCMVQHTYIMIISTGKLPDKCYMYLSGWALHCWSSDIVYEATISTYIWKLTGMKKFPAKCMTIITLSNLLQNYCGILRIHLVSLLVSKCGVSAHCRY